MFDLSLSDDDEHLVYGAILEGSQKPSEVLEAVLPYLEWAGWKQMEWGSDPTGSMSPYLIAEALRLLCKSSQHYDVDLDYEGDGLSEEMMVMTLHKRIEELMNFLDDFTAPGQRFGFDQGDLGVWTDWRSIDMMIEQGERAEITHPADIDQLDGKIRFALLDDGENLTFYAVSNGSIIWSI
jgi:hypothetical protein